MSRVFLIRVWPRDPATGAAVEVRLAGGGASLPYPQGYRGGIVSEPRFQAQFGYEARGFSGSTSPIASAISFAPAERAYLSELARLYWPDAAIQIDAGEEGTALTRLLTGTVARDQIQDDRLILTAADPSERMNKPLADTFFSGAGGVEGTADVAGSLKRRAFGRVFNVEGRLLDPANSIYEFADPAYPLQGVTALRDKGRAGELQLLGWQGSMAATFTALQAAAAPQGGGVFAPSIACAKWWTQPAGPLTADLLGEIGTGYADSAADVGASILAAVGGPAMADIAAARALRPAPAGIYIDSSETAAAALDRLFLGVSLLWIVSRLGSVEVRPWSFTPTEQLSGIFVSRQQSYPPMKTRRLGYRKNHRIHQDGEISAAVSDELIYEDGTPIDALRPAEPGATNGAPVGSPIAGRPAEQVIEQLDQARVDIGDILVDVDELTEVFGDTVAAAQSAAEAEAAKNAAVAAQDSAGGFATAASGQAAIATGAATAAASSATLSARVGGNSLSRNPYFADPTWGGVAGATTPNYPPGWQAWDNQGAGYHGKPANRPSAYGSPFGAMQIERKGLNSGMLTTLSGFYSAGWYVLEADVDFADGIHSGAGMFADWFDPDSPGGSVGGIIGNINFATDPDTAGRTGSTGDGNRKWAKLVYMGQDFRAGRLYAMAGWSGNDPTYRGALNTYWHKALIRAATQGEIDGRQARIDATANAASITALSTAVANADGALTQEIRTLRASAAPSGLLRNPRFQEWGSIAAGSTGAPTGWTEWSVSGRAEHYLLPAGIQGQTAGQPIAVIRIDDGVECGLLQDVRAGPGAYTIRARARLYNGTWQGAGVLVYAYDGAGDFLSAQSLSFWTEGDVSGFDGQPDSQGLGADGNLSRVWEKTINLTNSATRIIRVYAMAQWVGFHGTTGNSKTMAFEAVDLIPAGEVRRIDATLTQQAGAIATLQGESVAYWQVQGSVPNADFFITAQARSGYGQAPSSNVAIGARTFQVFNPSNGQWVEAMRVEGGNARFYGKVTAAQVETPSLDALSATIGLLRTAVSGQRVEIENNQIRVYNAAGTLKVRLGIW